MRCFYTILVYFLTLQASATNHYVSSAGNNLSDGLTPVTAWQTITKVNSSFAAFGLGDSLLFRKGDTFFGTLVIGRSGVSAQPIIIGSYGTGAKPIISGFTTLTGWVSLGSNVYRAPLPAAKNTLNMVTVDNLPKAVGRYPNADAANAGYLFLDAFSGTTSITDAALPSGTTDWTNAEMILMAKNWWIERTVITNHSGNVVTYRPGVKSFNFSSGEGFNLQTPDVGRGYFIQRDPETLDQFGEWYFDTAGVSGIKQLRMVFPGGNPNSFTVKASILDTLVSFGNKVYITLRDIAFEGANEMGTCAKDGGNISIINCDFTNMGSRAVFFWNTHDLLVDGISTNWTLSCGIDAITAHGDNAIIRNCTIKNNNPFPGMHSQWSDQDGKAIVVWQDHNLTINNNTVDTVGGAGIQFQGSNVLVQNNYVNWFDFVKDDMGAIYSYEPGTTPNVNHTNRVVKDNIARNGIGIPILETDCDAFYLDGITGNVLFTNNSAQNIANHSFYTNNPYNVTFRNNTSYNSGYGIGLARYYYGNSFSALIANNIFWATTAGGGIQEYINTGVNTPVGRTIQNWTQTGIGTVDSNFYHTRYKNPFRYWYYTAGPTPATTFNGGTAVEVVAGSDAITITSHTFVTGEPVTYSNGGGTSIGGLATGSTYYIISATVNTVKLATSYANANSGIAINISAGAGAAHTFTPSIQLFFNPSPALSINGWKSFSTKDGNTTITPEIKPYTLVSLLGSNTITNPTFDANITGTTVGGPANGTLDGPPGQIAGMGSLKVVFPASTGGLVFSSIVTGIGAIDNTKSYILRFATKGTTTFGGFARIYLRSNTGTILSDTQTVSFETAIVTHELNFNPTVSAGTAQVVMQFEQGCGTFYLDNFVFSEATVTLTDYSTKVIFAYNKTLTASTYSFSGRKKIDPRGNVYNDGALIQPYSSLILIDNGVTTSNQYPSANAGPDKVLTLPTNSTSVTGSGTDPDGTIAAYQWDKTGGPGTYTIASPNTATTGISGLVAGIYEFTLTVTDNGGLTATDKMTITVNNPPNQAPVANAGNDTTITLPANTVPLNGTASTDDVAVTGYSWAKTSGPATFTLTNGNTANATFSNLVQGDYTVTLTVTDGVLTSTATKVIHVLPAIPPANTPPVARAGVDQSITLPTSSVNLDGTTSTDADGTISSYNWRYLSGPNAPTFGTANASTTTVTGLIQGTYQIQLKVIDNAGDSGLDVMQITVNAQPANVLPIANAGTNQSITSPASSVNLTGTGTDSDGSIVSYAWLQVSGPSAGVFGTASSQNTSYSSLIPGVYKAELTVTDDRGGSDKDTVDITVGAPENQAPVANAGADSTIYLPRTTVHLLGSAIDADGTISSYAWTIFSGPGGSTFADATAAVTTIDNLVVGTYVVRLTVTDNGGLTHYNDVTIIVNEAIQVGSNLFRGWIFP